jgi:hypothetical protein
MKAKIIIRYGHTSKDHLLPEIQSMAEGSLSDSYASGKSARRAAQRAWNRVVSGHDLYRGCGPGFDRAEIE